MVNILLGFFTDGAIQDDTVFTYVHIIRTPLAILLTAGITNDLKSTG